MKEIEWPCIDSPTMTVGELISELSKHDPNLPVVTEGCDCVGEAFRVTFCDDRNLNLKSMKVEPYVIIERSGK